MTNVARIELAYELRRANQPVDYIAARVERNRATVYRWLNGIRLYGIREFIRRYQTAKQGRRQPRKTDPVIKQRIYAIREERHHCCGEKIRYWMKKQHDVTISVATIYRILGQKYQLRSKWKKNQARGSVPSAHNPREVVQTDTVDFGGVFAHTMIDIFTRETSVVLVASMEADVAAWALKQHMDYFGHVGLIQRDGGSEFEAEWEKTAPKYCDTIRTARPYKKNEQAFIESFNRTLRKECLGWVKYTPRDLPALQAQLRQFVRDYNTERPHLSLDMKAPIEMLSHLG